MQDNNLTSLGDLELFSFGPNLRSVDLLANPIGPVSGNALHGLRYLTEFLVFSESFTQCSYNWTLDAPAERLSCLCPSGLANDERLPSYCGWDSRRGLCLCFSSLNTFFAVNASLYRRCRDYLDNFSPKNVSNDDLNVPRLLCSFPAGKPDLVTCKAVCASGLVMSGSFSCDATRLSINVATVTCKVPENETTAQQSGNVNENGGNSSVGAIAGGTGAGAFVLVLLLVFFVLRRHRFRNQDHTQSTNDKSIHFGSFRSRDHGTILELDNLLKLKVERLFTLAFAGHYTEAKLTEAHASFATLEVARKCVKLDRVVGQGQGGEVYVANVNWPSKSARSFSPTVVAVKLLAMHRVTATFDLAGEEALQLEARLLHQLRHPHIVQVLATVTKSVPTWICLEFMTNGDLKSYLRFCSLC
jgi:hypothetical protein